MQQRLPTWVTLFGLSIVIIGATVDQYPGERGSLGNYCLATAVISLIFSFFFIVANLVDGLGNKVIGNVVENAISGIVLSLWVIAIAFIQSPQNQLATGINDQGQEVIIYANLYFFSWLNFLAAVYLFGNVIQNNFAFNPKFSQWVLLFAASVVLTATAVAVHDDICSVADIQICSRLKYALAVGSMGIFFSAISIIATMFGFTGLYLEIVTSALCCIFFFFGVVFLTTARGPGSTLGNIYFSVWGGCFISFVLLIGVAFPNHFGGNQEESSTSQQTQPQDIDHHI